MGNTSDSSSEDDHIPLTSDPRWLRFLDALTKNGYFKVGTCAFSLQLHLHLHVIDAVHVVCSAGFMYWSDVCLSGCAVHSSRFRSIVVAAAAFAAAWAPDIDQELPLASRLRQCCDLNRIESTLVDT